VGRAANLVAVSAEGKLLASFVSGAAVQATVAA